MISYAILITWLLNSFEKTEIIKAYVMCEAQTLPLLNFIMSFMYRMLYE